VRVGDLVRIAEGMSAFRVVTTSYEMTWRGLVIRHDSYEDGQSTWEIHWLHNPYNETTLEYEFYLEVISKA
jgi:hypothetical protein